MYLYTHPLQDRKFETNEHRPIKKIKPNIKQFADTWGGGVKSATFIKPTTHYLCFHADDLSDMVQNNLPQPDQRPITAAINCQQRRLLARRLPSIMPKRVLACKQTSDFAWTHDCSDGVVKLQAQREKT